jgi:hypothetical protein
MRQAGHRRALCQSAFEDTPGSTGDQTRRTPGSLKRSGWTKYAEKRLQTGEEERAGEDCRSKELRWCRKRSGRGKRPPEASEKLLRGRYSQRGPRICRHSRCGVRGGRACSRRASAKRQDNASEEDSEFRGQKQTKCHITTWIQAHNWRCSDGGYRGRIPRCSKSWVAARIRRWTMMRNRN